MTWYDTGEGSWKVGLECNRPAGVQARRTCKAMQVSRVRVNGSRLTGKNAAMTARRQHDQAFFSR